MMFPDMTVVRSLSTPVILVLVCFFVLQHVLCVEVLASFRISVFLEEVGSISIRRPDSLEVILTTAQPAVHVFDIQIFASPKLRVCLESPKRRSGDVGLGSGTASEIP